MPRLRFSERSRADLENIHDWIALDSPRNAELVHERLCQKFEQLLQQPRSGHRRDELKYGLRCVNSDGFGIFYHYRRGVVGISRIIHHSRNLTANDFDEES